jgi:hypothetical protein
MHLLQQLTILLAHRYQDIHLDFQLHIHAHHFVCPQQRSVQRRILGLYMLSLQQVNESFVHDVNQNGNERHQEYISKKV